jgi:hypothetical protein
MTMFIFSGCFIGLGVPGNVAHRAHAGVEVEHLAQRHVEAAEAAADGRGQRPLDADDVVGGVSFSNTEIVLVLE